MAKLIPLLDHLRNPAHRDVQPKTALSKASSRLQGAYITQPGGWESLTRIFDQSLSVGPAWFPDANVVLRGDTDNLWNALRRYQLRADEASTFITGIVEAEVSDWLGKPFHNKRRAATIREALVSKTWLQRFGIRTRNPLRPALYGYAHLLGIRRLLTRPTMGGITVVNTDPAAKSETMNAIRNYFGPRAIGLAKKGRIDAERTGLININDELNCLLAVYYALKSGRDAFVITADQDYVEIFYKIQWFFDTHYRAWLAAPLVKCGVFGQAERCNDSKGIFNGAFDLYQRPSSNLIEVLPSRYTPVTAGVFYLAPDSMLHYYGFTFEREMMGMLAMRAATNNRCTDLFDSSNIHVHLGPLTRIQKGLNLGIGQDTGKYFNTDGLDVFVSQMDAIHAMECRERFTFQGEIA
jgi:hypothetical protein